MKKVYVLLAISLILTLVGKAQDRDYSFLEEYEISEPAKFKLNTSDGNIKITPGSSDKIQVYYICRKKGRLLKISREELEEEVNIQVMTTSNSLEISVKYPQSYLGWLNRINVSFDVVVPQNTVCRLNSSDGNVHLTGLTGDQEIKTSDGNVHIRNISGKLDGRTSDGNIDLAGIKGDCDVVTSDGNLVAYEISGKLDGRTSDGNVVVTNVGGDLELVTSDGNITATGGNGLIELQTSDGHIKLSDANGNIKLKTSDGSISFNDVAGSMRAITSDGSIRGNLTSLRGELYMSTSDGSIDVVVPEGIGLDLAIKAERINTKFSQFDGTSKKHSVNGTVNGGGIPVELSAGDGSVTLSYK